MDYTDCYGNNHSETEENKMKTDITARFDSSDTAQRIAVYINELYGAPSDMYTTQITDGYYSIP